MKPTRSDYWWIALVRREPWRFALLCYCAVFTGVRFAYDLSEWLGFGRMDRTSAYALPLVLAFIFTASARRRLRKPPALGRVGGSAAR
ncbi:MAG: hypothetical protein K2X87_24140 [Gemmataceae bacterium]|nr:hypothetical protein [Gemmataceae bacterium]